MTLCQVIYANIVFLNQHNICVYLIFRDKVHLKWVWSTWPLSFFFSNLILSAVFETMADHKCMKGRSHFWPLVVGGTKSWQNPWWWWPLMDGGVKPWLTTGEWWVETMADHWWMVRWNHGWTLVDGGVKPWLTTSGWLGETMADN